MGSSGSPRDALGASDVAIVVPVGGSGAAWARAARSLARLDPAPGEIIAVVDGRDEGLAATAAEIGATAIVLERRGGPARARNVGARATGRALLLFVDADVEVPAGLAATVAGLFDANPGIDALFGSYDAAPDDPGLVSQYRNLLHHYVHQTAGEEAFTFWAGCGAVRRDVFLQAGGFDEAWPEPSIEDIELGSRLVRAGHAIRLVKDLQVKHLKPWLLRDLVSTDLWRRAVPWTVLMLRDGGLINDLNVKTRDRWSVWSTGAMLLALVGAVRWPALLAAAAAALALVVLLNAGLFGFFRRRRGWLFAAACVPLFLTYLTVCGLGFGLGSMRHLAGARR
jgi:glycosyltransferase involved in cell wall biosynthesis